MITQSPLPETAAVPAFPLEELTALLALLPLEDVTVTLRRDCWFCVPAPPTCCF
jgi:hypothetical protein